MADSETEQYGELVGRLAGDYPDVPQHVVEEQVAKAVEGTHLFGEVPTTAELVETIATENVARVDRAMRGGADLIEDDREPQEQVATEP
jgi:hypothetical protein